MKKYSIHFLSLVFTLFITSCNSNQKKTINTERESIDDYSAKIDSLVASTSPRTFNGVVLITQNGETKYSKAHGYADIKKKTSISMDDNFRIQSNTKQITATLILKEVENGKIILKNPIKEYLPDLESTWADSVTVHHLLNMSSGIVAIDEPLLFEPGTAYRYSNAAYALLGRIIKSVTGKEYAEVANGLFGELKMGNSYCYAMHIEDDKLVNGHLDSLGEYTSMVFDDPGFTEDWWTFFVPAGGIISNVRDLDKWQSKLHHGKILQPESYRLMTSYQFTRQHNAFGEKESGYGYGLFIDDRSPVKIKGHAGRGLGFVSIIFHIPLTNVNVMVLENVHTEDNNSVYYYENEIRKIVINSNLAKK